MDAQAQAAVKSVSHPPSPTELSPQKHTLDCHSGVEASSAAKSKELVADDDDDDYRCKCSSSPARGKPPFQA